LTVTGPGVRIPNSPQIKFSAWRSRAFLFYGIAKRSLSIAIKQKWPVSDSEQALNLILAPQKGINEINP
jgi:hypothetical protein